MSEEIVLIDVPSKLGRSWSPNGWKTRMLLNLKEIPYRTEWVPFVRLQETLKATGIAPNQPPEWFEYTIPFIRLPGGGPDVMDSLTIARALEARHPRPPMHLDAGVHAEAQAALHQAVVPLLPYILPRVGRDVVVEEDVEYFQRERAARFGVPLDRLEAERGGDGAWEAAGPGFRRLGELLARAKRDEGPFFLGSAPSYADVIVVATAQMFKVLGEEPFERFVGQDPAIGKLYEASKKWVERDDH